MQQPLNYFGYAFEDPRECYNDEYLETEEGQQEIEQALATNEEYKTQIKERGFDDTECWNLDKSIAEYVFPRLKHFKEVTHSYPADLTPEKWDIVLSKMIYAFDMVIKDEVYDLEIVEFEKINEGLELFGKYFRDLWD